MRKPSDEQIRLNNPFHFARVTEVEDLDLYRKTFSERILVGATLEIFKPANVVIIGPQGTGKSMLLNLLRHEVLSKWLADGHGLPLPLSAVLAKPFLGLSINLQRINFQVFGRRSVSRAHPDDDPEVVDAAFASDYLCHLVLHRFITALTELQKPRNRAALEWMGLRATLDAEAAKSIASWECWFGYYSGCDTLGEIETKARQRLSTWLRFLNVNINRIPDEMWHSKADFPEPMSNMGMLIGELTSGRTPLYITLHQYEVLPELNARYGTSLQRVVNSLIKTRDPKVFYRIGARTYDWGRELRVWGAESRLEFNRDYHIIDLGQILMRGEDSKDWLFPAFARDVASKRISQVYPTVECQVERIFGSWTAEAESKLYFREKQRRAVVVKTGPGRVRDAVVDGCGPNPDALCLRLADAWAMQHIHRGDSTDDICTALLTGSWSSNGSWMKERRGNALVQIASMANQRKRYFGWGNVVFLAGFNISAFLLICSEIWDAAAKYGIDPLESTISPIHQTEGVYAAADKYLSRDQLDSLGGSRRYDVINRLGRAIARHVLEDLTISNPGHTGFSLRETELQASAEGLDVFAFLGGGVNFGAFEEREHTSKNRESFARRKWFLHPLLSAKFGIPHKRVKEPLYVSVTEVHGWIFTSEQIRFAKSRRPLKKLPPSGDLFDR